ncbi:MAG: dihydroneopterin aldolase [Nannocystales bacterium]
MSDTIAIRGLQVDCIIGVHPHERDDPQPLGVDLELGLDLRKPGRTGRIGDTCDYARIATEVAAMLTFRRYQLLEAAAEEICAMLLGLHPVVETTSLRLNKPRALAGVADAAMVGIERSRADYPRRFETSRFGQVEILLETREAGLYLLHVESGKSIPPHHHQVMRELEWIIDGELSWDGARLPIHTVREWPVGHVHGYDNQSDRRATVFCCDTPPFIPADEIEVSA